MNICSSLANATLRRDVLYNLSFFLVEMFSAWEVTAALVAAPRIGQALALPEALNGWVINAYLYPIFVFSVLFLLVNRSLRRVIASRNFFFLGCWCSRWARWLFVFWPTRRACSSPAGSSRAWAPPLPLVANCGRRGSITGQPLPASCSGECGGALGVVTGPMVGGILIELAAQGWRFIFLLDGVLSLIALGAGALALRQARPCEFSGCRATRRFNHLWPAVLPVVGTRIAVSSLAVGAEYLFSDYLQLRLGKSALFSNT